MIKKVWRVRPEPGHYWIYDIWLGGRRLRTPKDSYFADRKECEDAVAMIRADYRRGKYNFPADQSRVTIADVRDRWLKQMRRLGRNPKRIKLVENAFNHLAVVIPLTSPATEIRTAHLEKMIDQRRLSSKRNPKGARLPTIINDLNAILSAIKFAADNIPELSSWKPPRRPEGFGKQKLGRQRVISLDEERAILGELRRSLSGKEIRHARARRQTADIFELALLTGARRNELLKLAWDDVHLGRTPGYPYGWVVFRGTKSADPISGQTANRTVPLVERSAELLKRRKAEAKSRAVFPATGTRRSSTGMQTMISWALKSACERVGVPYGRDRENGMVFHDTRHTAITRMLQAGADLKTVMDLVGHKDAETTLRYTHSNPTSMFSAVSLLGVRLESKARTDETGPGPTGSTKNGLQVVDEKAG